MDPQPDTEDCEGIEERFSVLSLTPLYPSTSQFSPYFQLLFSNISNQEIEGLRQIRKLISIEKNPPLLELVQTNVLPKLIEMAYSRTKDFIFELCWVLCNIGSGSSQCAQYLMDIKTLDFLNNVFDFDPTAFDLQNQIFWVIGNIAGESAAYRDAIIESPIFPKLLQYVDRFLLGHDKQSCHIVWALASLGRGTPKAPIEALKVLDRYYVSFVLKSQTDEMLVDACWALSYTTDLMESIDQYPTELLRKLIVLTNHEALSIAVPCIRSIGNVASFTDSVWGRLKDLNLVEFFVKLLSHPKNAIRREVFWTLSNLCMDCSEAVDALKNFDAFRIMIGRVDQEPKEIVREILWTVANSAKTGSSEFRKYLIDISWHVKMLNHFFSAENHTIRMVIVEGLIYICANNKDCLDDDYKSNIKRLALFNYDSPELIKKLETLLGCLMEDNDIEMN
jgi:importin subunit alpha-6/7